MQRCEKALRSSKCITFPEAFAELQTSMDELTAEMQMGVAAKGAIRKISFRRFIDANSVRQAIHRIRFSFGFS